LIRHVIVDLFKRDGTPPTLASLASEMKCSEADIRNKLAGEDRLSDLRGLTLKQASQLLGLYDTVFTDEIVKLVNDTVAGQGRLKRIEAKKRKNDPPLAE
jgi:hypothetical protein